jgi:2',3'-cyclic-nucleotide 2'-phosphodiesterase (5'-nucleotidase family)
MILRTTKRLKTPKRLICTLVAIILSSALSWGHEQTVLTFLHFNDIYTFSPNANGVGGFAPLKTLIDREVENAKGPTMVTFGGDAISPTAMGGVTKGAHMIELLNAVWTEVAVPGNHEFDFGPEVFHTRLEESRFPWLGANMLGPDGKVCCGMKDNILIDMGGVKVGVFGLLTETTAGFSSAGSNIFRPFKEVAEEQVRALKEKGAEVIVALTHLSFQEDQSLSKVEGIHLVLGGHEHDAYAYLNSKKEWLSLKVGWNGEYLGVVELPVERSENGVTVKAPSWKVLAVQDLKPDGDVQSLVRAYELKQDKFNVVIGKASTPINTILALVAGKETPLGGVIADAMRKGTGADVALIHGFNFRGMTKESGENLTHLNILDAIPFANTVVVVELTGAQLKDTLEHAVSGINSPNPRLLSRFLQVAGLQFDYDPAENARGSGCPASSKGTRIKKVTVAGTPLDDNRTSRVAINNFMAEGGNGYCMLAEAPRSSGNGNGGLLTDMVVDYIKEIGEVKKQPSRITELSK